MLATAGNLAVRLSDYGAARAYYVQALALSRQLGDRRAEGGICGNLGTIAQYEGDAATARAHHERTLAVARESGDRTMELTALVCIGNAANARDEYEVAHSLLKEALCLSRALGARGLEANILNNIGNTLMNVEGYATARASLEEGQAICREVGLPHEEAWSVLSLGMLAGHEGRPGESSAYLKAALRSFNDQGNAMGAVAAVAGLATADAAAVAAARAARLAGAAARWRVAIELPEKADLRRSGEGPFAGAREALGDETFAREWDAGQELTPEETARYALAESMDAPS